ARRARKRILRSLGGRRAVELPDLEYRPPVLHAQRRVLAAPRVHVSIGAAVSEVQARGRVACGRARQDLGVRAERRISTGLRAPRTAWPRGAPARIRSAQEAAAAGRAVRRGAQAATAGVAAKDRDR